MSDFISDRLSIDSYIKDVNEFGGIQIGDAFEDKVNHPAHYKAGGVETIDFIEAKELGYHLGNVVKYISRAGIKSHDPLEDLKKAQWYLNRYVNKLEMEKQK